MNELYEMALAKNGEGILARQLSPIHGYGLFSTGDLPAGMILGRRLGLRTMLSLRDKRAILGIDGIDAANPDDLIFKNINHSCHPNACLTDSGCLINMEDIAPQGEITVDYCSLLPGSDWESPCQCGQPDCRKVIKPV